MNDPVKTTTSPIVGRTQEPIPGYRLIERVGVGGYGEVWKAEAPGGLTKAVKLVFGHMDDDLASRELKALNRIKEVRHPFLLSLERIEVVDGQLIVVTELAESNLNEVLAACQQAGMPGIERDRLLGYLKDTAEALDYIRDSYNLQHLDVKPENLLLIADRVKVADFGLVRELFNASASMMGGLTPNYAPPEVFDGRPNPHSDQYSLAIVYQELLTGSLPFSGRTAAQLAAQHMHSQPRLESLPAADRIIVGRALMKDPAKRFPSCSDFIKTLMKPELAAAAIIPRRAPAVRHSPSATISLDDVNNLNRTQDTAACPNEGVEMIALPPLELSGEQKCRPILFLGIGGVATETMRSLRRRLRHRFGDLEDVPAIQMLVVDTDSSALAQACTDGDETALDACDTLAMPLRRTQDYRSDSDKFLSWMSRRWIYNIPRSQQTEGFRPLGRLALVDHADKLMQRLRDVIGVLSDEDTVKASTDATGVEFEAVAPQIYIVASIAGGTGSGMVLDVAYAVRQVLAEHGHSDEGVCGILTHHTDRRASAHDLAVANSLACLQELKHFSQPAGSYPGDATMGLASFNGRTFHHEYVVHLGDNIGSAELSEQLDRVAEYLFCNAVTASEFFETSRRNEFSGYPVNCPETSVRSFGLRQFGLLNSPIPTVMADGICSGRLDDWKGGFEMPTGEKRAKFSDVLTVNNTASDKVSAFDRSVDCLAQDHAATLRFDVDQLCREALQLAEDEMGRDSDAYFADLVRQFQKQYPDATGPSAVKSMMDLTDRMLGTDNPDDQHEQDFLPLQEVINDRLIEVGNERAASLREWVWELVDNSRGHILGARRATKWLAQHMQGQARKAGDRAKSDADEAMAVRRAAADPAKNEEVEELASSSLLASYYHLRLSQALLRSVAKMLRRIDELHVAAMASELHGLLRELNLLSERFVAHPVMEAPQPDGTGALTFQQYVEWLAQTTLSHRSAELGALVEADLFGEDGGLRTLLASNVAVQTDFADTMRRIAGNVLRNAVREVNVAEVVLAATASSQDQESNPLRQSVDAIAPCWTDCGGAKRLLTIVPRSSGSEPMAASLERYLGEPLTVAFDTDGDLVFCYEAEGLDIVDVAWKLVGDRPDLLQVAARLHTRADIDFLSLV